MSEILRSASVFFANELGRRFGSEPSSDPLTLVMVISRLRSIYEDATNGPKNGTMTGTMFPTIARASFRPLVDPIDRP